MAALKNKDLAVGLEKESDHAETKGLVLTKDRQEMKDLGLI
jgi:hypothetical protein